MTTRFYFEKIRDTDKQILENYFQEKKLGRLEKLLLHGNAGLAKLVINADYHPRHDTYIVRVGLNFGKKDLNSEIKGNTLLEAFDLAFDKIVSQLRKVESKRHDK